MYEIHLFIYFFFLPTFQSMQSSVFGPGSWSAMFYAAAGYDLNETPKRIKDPQYKAYFKSIGDVLPCRYCRDSYKIFFDSLDFDKYLKVQCGLIRFVYDLKNLVNEKLEKQEEKALQEEYEKLLREKSPNDPTFWKTMRAKSHKICFTKPAPPFEQVVADLMKHRASCSAKMKSCREPLNAAFPVPPDTSKMGLERPGPTDAEIYKSGGKQTTRKRTVKSVKRRASIRKRKTSVKTGRR
jgi:hypothetical protein